MSSNKCVFIRTVCMPCVKPCASISGIHPHANYWAPGLTRRLRTLLSTFAWRRTLRATRDLSHAAWEGPTANGTAWRLSIEAYSPRQLCLCLTSPVTSRASSEEHRLRERRAGPSSPRGPIRRTHVDLFSSHFRKRYEIGHLHVMIWMVIPRSDIFGIWMGASPKALSYRNTSGQLHVLILTNPPPFPTRFTACAQPQNECRTHSPVTYTKKTPKTADPNTDATLVDQI